MGPQITQITQIKQMEREEKREEEERNGRGECNTVGYIYEGCRWD